jgi:hypothetical protein
MTCGAWRLCSLGAVCGALILLMWSLGPVASAARPARYVLVQNGWDENDCGDPQSIVGEVVPLDAGRGSSQSALRGLDASLIPSFTIFNTTVISDDGAHLAWTRGRGLFYGDLLTGRSRLLAALAPYSTVERFVLGPHGRAAVAAVDNDTFRLVLVAYFRGRVKRRTVKGEFSGFSADGRFVSYDTHHGTVVRSMRTDRIRRLGHTDDPAWSPTGHRLAYATGNRVRVLDAVTGRAINVRLTPDQAENADLLDWSPDAHYLDLDTQTVVNLATARTVQLPPGPTDEANWRPGHPHQLMRNAYGDTDPAPVTGVDLVDVSAPVEIWGDALRSNRFEWAPNGGWMLARDSAVPVILRGSSGRRVGLPRALRRGWGDGDWLSGAVLQLGDSRVLRIARPPTWKPHVIARSASGHTLSARSILTATPAGLGLVARAFGPAAKTRDC